MGKILPFTRPYEPPTEGEYGQISWRREPIEEIQHNNSAAYALVAIAFIAGVLIGTLIR